MLKAELRYLHSADALDIQNYIPENPDNFCISIQAIIGPKDEPGEESFEFIVCTPTWLSEKISETGFVLGRHYLFVLKYEYDLIEQIIKNLCHKAKGEDWHTIGNYLARDGFWEFEDYEE